MPHDSLVDLVDTHLENQIKILKKNKEKKQNRSLKNSRENNNRAICENQRAIDRPEM